MPEDVELPDCSDSRSSKAAAAMRHRAPRAHVDSRVLDVTLEEAMKILRLGVTSSRPSSKSRSGQHQPRNKTALAKLLGPSQQKAAMTASFGCLAAPGGFGSFRNSRGQLLLPSAAPDLADASHSPTAASSATPGMLPRSTSKPSVAETRTLNKRPSDAGLPFAGSPRNSSPSSAAQKDPFSRQTSKASSSGGARSLAMKAKLQASSAEEVSAKPTVFDTSMAMYELSKSTNISYADLQDACELFKKYADWDEQDDIFMARLQMTQFQHVLCDMCQVSSIKDLQRDFVFASFQQADRDGSGDIDLREFVAFYAASSFHEAINLGKDEEYMRGLARNHDMTLIELENVSKAFKKYDADGSGEIELDEFQEVLRDVLKLRPEQDLPDERANALWRMADKKGQGFLDFEQFLDFHQKYFGQEGGTDPNSAFYKSFRRV